MASPSTGADALIEILNLCEQTLIALELTQNGNRDVLRMDNPNRPSQRPRTNFARPFVLVRGGRADDAGSLPASESTG